MSAVWVMRAIVWWVPHSGHWETSSKRLRQLTQRSRPGSWVGRSQGSPQFGQGARASRLLRLGASDIGLIMADEAADEEAGRPVAVGAQLERARLVGRGELRRQGTEVVELERRRLARG